MVNFLGILQNEWAGAQALSSFDTYLAPFVKADSLPESEVKQCVQSFMFGVNTPSRWGSQAPFTNITLDWTVPADLAKLPAVVGGQEQDFTYGDCQAEMDLINRVFIELMLSGDADGRGFQYPIPTYNVTKDFDWDTQNARLLFEMTAKYGTPYFQNFINSDLDPGDVRSMCCRLQLDKRELRKRGGGLFGSDELTGSIGVVTLNLPRIGYLADSRTDFFRRLDRLMDLAAESLWIKRKVCSRLLSAGLFPYTRRYLKGFDNHFSTIGLVGMNECCLNFLGKGIETPDGKAFALEVLGYMRKRLQDFQESTGELFNLEATPAESTSYRLAKHDKRKYPQIMTSGATEPYYTNSSQLPVGLYRGHLRRAGSPGGPSDPVHGRDGLPHLSRRGRGGVGSRAGSREGRGGQLPDTVFHDLSDLLDLPRSRLPFGRAFFLPQVQVGEGSAPARGNNRSREGTGDS